MIHAIAPNLSIGDLDACRQLAQAPYRTIWTVVHACKEPCHRQALGYSGRALDPTHPGYLSYETQQPDSLYLNLVDAADPRFFSVPLMARALDYIDAHHKAVKEGSGENWKQVLIHCNQGKSRAAGIALLYLFTRLQVIPTYDMAKALFIQAHYPEYHPGPGLEAHLREKWSEYAMDGFRKGSPLSQAGPYYDLSSYSTPPSQRKRLLYGEFLPEETQSRSRKARRAPAPRSRS